MYGLFPFFFSVNSFPFLPGSRIKGNAQTHTACNFSVTGPSSMKSFKTRIISKVPFWMTLQRRFFLFFWFFYFKYFFVCGRDSCAWPPPVYISLFGTGERNSSKIGLPRWTAYELLFGEFCKMNGQTPWHLVVVTHCQII